MPAAAHGDEAVGSEELVGGEGEGSVDGLALGLVDGGGVVVADVVGVQVGSRQLDVPVVGRAEGEGAPVGVDGSPSDTDLYPTRRGAQALLPTARDAA